MWPLLLTYLLTYGLYVGVYVSLNTRTFYFKRLQTYVTLSTCTDSTPDEGCEPRLSVEYSPHRRQLNQARTLS